MPTGLTRLNALDLIERLKLEDSVAIARQLKLPDLPVSWPKLQDMRARDRAGIQKLLQMDKANPDHPANWHRRAVEAALRQPRVGRMYFLIRKSLWQWREFLLLKNNAKRTLEVVIELARDEAFPWYVSAQAELVMKLARFERKTYSERLRELECLTITRPARRIHLMSHAPTSSLQRRAAAMPAWPSAANCWGVDDQEPLEEIPQWVVRYRRGTPYRKRRAAWWINYDLLCETGRVLPCFEVGIETLPRNYFDRNRRFGTRPGVDDEDAFRALERKYAKDGPLPPTGMRAALWEGMEFRA